MIYTDQAKPSYKCIVYQGDNLVRSFSTGIKEYAGVMRVEAESYIEQLLKSNPEGNYLIKEEFDEQS